MSDDYVVGVSNDPSRRLLKGMMLTINLPFELLEQPSTTVIGRPDRADTGMALCYRVGPTAIIWTDPVLEDRFAELADAEAAVSVERFSAHAKQQDLTHLADATMRVLTSGYIEAPTVPDPYRHRRLTNDDVDLVRRLTEKCPLDEVEAAALEELDEFDEAAINVLTADGDDTPLAYASGADWDWDDAFADMGVLVHPEHRRLGLGGWVVAQSAADLLDQGRIPLYRHILANTGSAALSAGLGFEPVLWLQAYGPES